MLALHEKYKGRSVLITGGLGFIGSNLAHRLASIDDIEITIIDALYPEQGGNLKNISGIEDRVKVHQADLCDSYVVNHLVGGVDYIFNLAGSVSHVDSMTSPHHDLQLNCSSQLTLLEACRMFNPHVKIVYTSTRQVYGKPVYLPLDEEHRLAPLDINGINKLAAENYHQLYHRVYGLPVVCLRLCNTYGPRQLLQHNRQGFIPWFIRKAIDGEIIELFGEGRQRRDMNFVDDVIDALLLAGLSESVEGEIFNLGNEFTISLVELANELIRITGRGSTCGVPFPHERQLIDVGNCYSSYKKIERMLGWRPRTSLEEGLKKTVAFYEKNREHYWKTNASFVS